MSEPLGYQRSRPGIASGLLYTFVFMFMLLLGAPQQGYGETAPKTPPVKEGETETDLSWAVPARVSIYDVQFGAAVYRDKRWDFLGNMRSFSAEEFKGRLTLMVRFSYRGSKADIPMRFVIELPGARKFEDEVRLAQREGRYSYKFTIHNPESFVGSGSVILYCGFTMLDTLQFTIMPGS